jgi:type IV pilus assembly protein PilA
MKSNKNEKGFSLVELLVVVIIIAIVAAIAIPNLLASRRAANEASAVSSLRTIHSAEATYQALQGAGSNYGTLVELNAAGLIDSALGAATSQKSGYTFNATLGTQIYCATGVPTTPGTTGDNYYGVETEGVIWRHTAAMTCAAGDLTPLGAPIQ